MVRGHRNQVSILISPGRRCLCGNLALSVTVASILRFARFIDLPDNAFRQLIRMTLRTFSLAVAFHRRSAQPVHGDELKLRTCRNGPAQWLRHPAPAQLHDLAQKVLPEPGLTSSSERTKSVLYQRRRTMSKLWRAQKEIRCFDLVRHNESEKIHLSEVNCTPDRA